MKKAIMWLIVLVISIPLVLFGSLAGCQPAEPAAEAPDVESAVTEAPDVESAVTEAPDVEPGISVIRFLNQETLPAAVAVQRAWIEDFKAVNTDIDVILEAAPADVINQTIATYVQAGAPLDIVGSDGGSAARLAVEGVLAPLDDVVENLGGRDAFLRGRLLIYNDQVYAINQTATGPVMHYRKDIFEDLGLEPPTDWESILTAAKTIHEEVDGMAGIALPGGENRATTIYAGIYLWQNGGDFFNPDLEVTIDNERTYEALEYYAELLKYAPEEASGWSFFEPIESFFSERSAMVMYWHGLDLTYDNNPGLILDDKVGVTFPEGRMLVTEQGGRYYVVFNQSADIEASKKFIEYIFTPENSAKLTEVGPQIYVPETHEGLELLRQSDAPRMEAYGRFILDLTVPSVTDFGYNQILNAGGLNRETLTLEDNGIINPHVSVLWNSNLYARAIQQVAYAGVSPEEAAAECQAALEAQIE